VTVSPAYGFFLSTVLVTTRSAFTGTTGVLVEAASWPLPSLSSIVEAVSVSLIAGAATTGGDVESGSVTFEPSGAVPVAVAVLSTVPASTSAWVSV
jgi:hypothetical protein